MNSMNQMCAVVGGVVIVVGLMGCEEKKPAAAAVSETEAAPQVEDAGPIYIRLHSELDPALVKKAAEFDGSVDGQLAGMLTSSSGVIQQAIAASKMPTCDFGERNTSLVSKRPGLIPTRSLARLLRVDAKRCLEAGDVDGAAERTGAILRLSRQVASGAECSIDVLVACSVMQLGTEQLKELSGKAISGPAKDDLKSAAQKGSFAKVPDRLAAEYMMMAKEMRSNPKFVESLGEMRGESKKFTAEEIEASAAGLEKFAGMFVGLWNGPDAEGELAAAAAKLPEIAAQFAGLAAKQRGSVREAEEKMAMARAGIR